MIVINIARFFNMVSFYFIIKSDITLLCIFSVIVTVYIYKRHIQNIFTYTWHLHIHSIDLANGKSNKKNKKKIKEKKGKKTVKQYYIFICILNSKQHFCVYININLKHTTKIYLLIYCIYTYIVQIWQMENLLTKIKGKFKKKKQQKKQ